MTAQIAIGVQPATDAVLPAEGFVIRRTAAEGSLGVEIVEIVEIVGGGAAGAMYGAFELAE